MKPRLSKPNVLVICLVSFVLALLHYWFPSFVSSLLHLFPSYFI